MEGIKKSQRKGREESEARETPVPCTICQTHHARAWHSHTMVVHWTEAVGQIIVEKHVLKPTAPHLNYTFEEAQMGEGVVVVVLSLLSNVKYIYIYMFKVIKFFFLAAVGW